MLALNDGARVSGDGSGMTLGMFEQPLPEGGPHKSIDHSTPIHTILTGMLGVLRDLAVAVKSIPDEHIPEDKIGKPLSRLSQDLHELSISPEVVGVKARCERIAGELGLR